MTDEEILLMLREGREHTALTKLYTHLPKVERMVRNNSGTRADAKDLFQDALIILHRKARSSEFQLTCGLGTYLYAVCRNNWQAELRRRGRFTQELEAAPDEPTDLDELLATEGRNGLAERALSSLGATCLDLLKRFYLLKEPLVAIAKSLGLAGEGAAKTRKYKCLEEARKRFRALAANAGDINLQAQ
ncbi:MAG: sigma-70 family RNA polymerase sigma factor [Flavobacteriales bacterium]